MTTSEKVTLCRLPGRTPIAATPFANPGVNAAIW